MGIKNKIICTVSNDLNQDRRMIRICTSLQKNGWEVLLIGFNRKNSNELSYKIFLQNRLSLIFQNGKFSYLEINLRLFFYLLFKYHHVVCAVDMDTLPGVFLASKLKKTKLIFDAHEYFSEVPEVENRKIVKKIWKTLESFLIPKVANKYTVSEGLKTEMKKLNYGDFEVIKNVPFSYSIANEFPKNEKIIIYQGDINKGRGIYELIFAIEKLQVKIWIIGDGKEKENLSQLVENISWKNKIFFLGKITPEDLSHYTQKASIGYNVLEPLGKSYQVSLANKFFDYIQAEIPSICNDFEDYNTLNNNHEVAYLIPFFSIEEIKKGLEKLLNDESYYKKLKNNCKQAKLEYNWEKEEQKLVQFYKNIL